MTDIRASDLRGFATTVLEAIGMSSDDASIAANGMVWADLRGLHAHGVTTKLPQCIGRIRAGGTSASSKIETLSESPAMAVLDAGNAWGQVAAARAMEMAIDRARTTGIGGAVLRNGSSAAAMGYYPSLAVRDHMIGLAFTNGPALLAPSGGTTKVLGNQAHAMGCPAGRHFPIIFDSATSSMSTGEMDMAAERGELLPEGVLLDAFGVPTRDPNEWKTGVLVPAGGHRGYGLSLLFEVMTGVLSGGERWGPDVGHPFVAAEPQGVSMCTFAINPDVVMPYLEFVARVDELIDAIHASPPAAGHERVYVPGERSALLAAERERDGIPLSDEQTGKLRDLGASLGVSWSPS